MSMTQPRTTLTRGQYAPLRHRSSAAPRSTSPQRSSNTKFLRRLRARADYFADPQRPEQHPCILIALLCAPTLAGAQAAFPTAWPEGSKPLPPDSLRQRLVGKTFVAKSVTGADVRVQYQETYAFINVGDTSDSGPWRTEGSAVCNEWKKLRPACSEIRALGESLYVKRANTGEIMTLLPR